MGSSGGGGSLGARLRRTKMMDAGNMTRGGLGVVASPSQLPANDRASEDSDDSEEAYEEEEEGEEGTEERGVCDRASWPFV
jgi:hypothetical protein